MKVGILTLHYGLNYGGMFQAYAIGEILRMLGHEPLYLDRIPKALGTVSYLLKRKFAYPFLHHDFDLFRKQYLTPLSAPAFSSSGLREITRKNHLDAILVGSDQVWRKEVFDVNGDYFLGFCDGLPVRRIAFAASFGIGEWNRNEEETREVSAQLKKFHRISVRENSGVDLLQRHCGVDGIHILDPVLIAGKTIFEKLAATSLCDDTNKIATYLLDPQYVETGILEELKRDGAVLDHLLPLDTSRRYRRFFPAPEIAKTLPEWIKRIATADFVLTDSFHGTAFSILFNRNFAVLTNPARGNSRIDSLLSLFHLQSRFCRSGADLAKLKTGKIDFEPVNRILSEEQKKAFQFLSEALGEKE